MARMIAFRDLTGTGFIAGPGQEFETTEQEAEELAARGLAEYAYVHAPSATYETKVIVPVLPSGRLKSIK